MVPPMNSHATLQVHCPGRSLRSAPTSSSPWAMSLAACLIASTTFAVTPDQPNEVIFPPKAARFVRVLIHSSSQSEPCLDELEIYAPQSTNNLALASRGAKATASSCLPGHAIHQIAHLNDGLYGNSHSWIAAGRREEWAQIELPQTTAVARAVFSRDRAGQFRDRVPIKLDVQLSADGKQWETVAKVDDRLATRARAASLPQNPKADDLLRYAFLSEAKSFQKIDQAAPAVRVLRQMEEMIARFAQRGLDVAPERAQLADLRHRVESSRESVLVEARHAKRRLFFRDPDLALLERILFVKRQPYWPSHNYSDLMDAEGEMGGAVCRLDIPRRDGRLETGDAKLVQLFDAHNGVARDAAANFDRSKIYFSSKGTHADYFHVMEMNPDGSGLKQITDGPFHDVYPCPLPDGGLAFVSTRCKARFLCWRPQAYVLFRMERDGSRMQPLSFANLSEWAPSVTRDGRILWTRSEYLDKGADFGHTLWSIRPDGSHPEMIFGNNTLNCYLNAREVPGTSELLCTLISHGGDLNGPIALIDTRRDRYDSAAITSLTPDVPPRYHMDWARRECFRDPVPVSRDYFLCSHAPEECFGLYVIDRFGNREVLYLDPEMSSVCPTPLHAAPPPPYLRVAAAPEETSGMGQFVVADIYRGLEPAVKRGSVKYLRVCQEIRSDLAQLPNGEFQKDHPDFEDWYASPTHRVTGPSGWPSYVAKGVFGLAPVESDGSANFLAPAGKVLYFQALDENLTELQRMRSVVQLQPGEQRSCIGCHENRATAPPVRPPLAITRPPSVLQKPSWGAGPFGYEKVVQPVWDAKCVRCHNAQDPKHFNLAGTLDAERVPASYRTLITQGWVHYFNYRWGEEHRLAEPASFGTIRSRLLASLKQPGCEAQLGAEDLHRIKCWIDLNCPLWPDYTHRPERPGRLAGP